MIRKASTHDIPRIAAIDRESFSGNKTLGTAEQWYTDRLNQGQQYHIYVFEHEGQVIGFIGWELLNGYARVTPVLEIQKLAVDPQWRGQGFGSLLVRESAALMKEWVHENHPTAKEYCLCVWTKKENGHAAHLYQSLCPETAGERELFGTSEVLMIGHHRF